VIQRYGGALNLNVHFHALFIDGVYTRDDPLATARFHELPAPSQQDVEWTLARVYSRVQHLLESRLDGEASLPEDETLLARLADASVRGRQATGADRDEPLAGLFTPPTASRPTAPPSLLARGAGFSLHAGVAVEADRRGRLEHLCRYVTRPPLATERLSLDEQGRILLRLRHPHSDGRTHVVFTPRTLLERLCALIPRPRSHQVTYHGVLASASTFRDDVVPSPTHGVRARAGAARALSIDRRLRWAELMKRTFDLDLLRCECGARREVIACILQPAVARTILRHLGLPHEPPASSPSRAPPVLEFA